MKKAGILMPVASLPGRFGSGDFGPEAYRFAEDLARAGFSIWQILPLNPVGYGNSPYQPYSSFAMDELYLSLDLLEQQGLLDHVPDYHVSRNRISYEEVRAYKERYLRKAFSRFREDLSFMTFSFQEWMRHYALFLTFRKIEGNKPWPEWENPAFRDLPLNESSVDLKQYEDEILYQVFLQYELFLQWKNLKQHVNDLGLEIVGDIPFYPGLDSADVWSHRESFLLDKDGHPRFIAGVPPDCFSEDGQRWGNPIYNWNNLKKHHYSFWIDRLGYTTRLYDVVRLDHFRAFDTYWKIPASCPTAREGTWIMAPGKELLDLVREQIPDLKIVAEDLGELRPQVLKLRDRYQFAGMNILEFTFDPEREFHTAENCYVYTGTHDNDPIRAWYQDKSASEKRACRNWLQKHGYDSGNPCDSLIRVAMNSEAEAAVIPMADFLHLGKEGRINTPSTVGPQNWSWRMKDFLAFEERIPEIAEMIRSSGRGQEK